MESRADDSMWTEAGTAVEAIQARDGRTPEWAVVLGSGLGGYADSLANPTVIPYVELPGFAQSTVSGHAGQLVIGEVGGMVVAALKGRVHLYEGLPVARVVYPLRVMWRLGARRLLVTNAAGGVAADLEPGDLALIRDHINLTGQNPLVGPNDDRWGPRFPDMSVAYDVSLRELAQKVAAQQGISLKSGVYAGQLGPTYETPSEVRMAAALGADLVGMSTVLEVIAARHMQMQVLGISCVTNKAAGLSNTHLAHHEVEETARSVRDKFTRLVDGILRQAAGEQHP